MRRVYRNATEVGAEHAELTPLDGGEGKMELGSTNGGDLEVADGTGIPVQPAGIIPVGETTSSSPSSDSVSRLLPLGIQQAAAIRAKGIGGTSTFNLTLNFREAQ